MLKGCADVDEPLTLLSDVGAFKAWLRSESTWGHAAESAEGVLRSLLELPALRGLVERARQRWMCPEAYQALRQVRRGRGESSLLLDKRKCGVMLVVVTCWRI